MGSVSGAGPGKRLACLWEGWKTWPFLNVALIKDRASTIEGIGKQMTSNPEHHIRPKINHPLWKHPYHCSTCEPLCIEVLTVYCGNEETYSHVLHKAEFRFMTKKGKDIQKKLPTRPWVRVGFVNDEYFTETKEYKPFSKCGC